MTNIVNFSEVMKLFVVAIRVHNTAHLKNILHFDLITALVYTIILLVEQHVPFFLYS